MTAFPKPLTIAFVSAAALAALSLSSDSEIWSDLPRAERIATAECRGHSAACMVEANYAYPAGDLSVVPPDVYFLIIAARLGLACSRGGMENELPG